MNSVVLVGRLTKDPVLRYTQDSKAVADFTLAVDRRFNRDQTDFIRIVVWGKQAENCANYLKKGSRAAVSGSIQTGSYTDKNGITRYTTDIVANEVEFLSSAGGGGGAPRSNYDAPVQDFPNESANERPDIMDISEDEIPF